MSDARFEILISDLNGIFRGSSLPLADAPPEADAPKGGIRWPASLFSSRFDGAVVEECDYSLRCGDPDYPCVMLAGTEAPVPWRGDNRQGVFVMHRPDGAPFLMDPWHVLARVLRRFADERISPTLAIEFEFYLADETLTEADGQTGMSDLYSVDELARRGEFLSAVTDAAAKQGVPSGNILSEYGAGQWEVNLVHTDAASACLHGLLLRRIVRACAAAIGKRATFMAKPYSRMAGSGMHIHLSLWRDGVNLFADESVLHNAVAGALSVCGEAFAFFAPWENSYRRFMPGGYVPLTAGWAQENRAAAVRLPHADADGERRLEFRVCGADANPLLAAAALLAGAYDGMQKQTPPPPQQKGDVAAGAPLPQTWRAALERLAAAEILPEYFDADFLRHYSLVKESEWRHQLAHVSDYDRLCYGRVM